ncbi:hypothetical protein D3C71_2224630 [compost metagenome]
MSELAVATGQAVHDVTTYGSYLFYRLNLFPVTIALLHEHKDDLPLLHLCVTKLSTRHGRRMKKMAQSEES